METDHRLIFWALAQKSLGRLDLKIDRLNWTDEIAPDLFDFEARLQFQSTEFAGRGTGFSETEALNRALGEVFERTVAAQLKTGSNGLAVHPDLGCAMAAAQRELIERDAFLSSYLKKLPVKPHRDGRDLVHPALLRPIANLEARGIQLELFEVAVSHEQHVCMAILWGQGATPQFGMNVGLGCEAELNAALDKAIMEVLRNGAWCLKPDNKLSPMTADEFAALDIVTARDHLALALNVEFARQQHHHWHDRPESSVAPRLAAFDTFSFEKLEFSSDLGAPPLHCVRASNKNLQALYWGADHDQHIHPERIGPLERAADILPHPLG